MEEEEAYVRELLGAFAMTMPDGRGPMIPDLDWFDRTFSPDRRERERLAELAAVYGEEHIMSVERAQAERRRKRAPEVRDLRRAWLSRNAIYGKQDDYGSF